MLEGSIVMFAGSTAPAGWLICDGTAVSRSEYSAIFATIGTSFGEGDGSTTFNLPDLSGRVMIGSSNDHPVASIGGEENHNLATSELPSHSHSVGQHGHSSGITITTPALSHSITQATFTYIKPNGSGTASASGGNAGKRGTTSTNATLSTQVAVADHAAAACTVSGSIDDCDAFYTENAGLGEQHSNMQPFITMNYIIYAGA